MPDEREYFLPELPRLLPVGYHPKAAQIEIGSNGWVRRQLGSHFTGEDDLLRFLRERNGLYGPLVVPDADDDRAQNVADWYQFVALFDGFAEYRAGPAVTDLAERQVFRRILADSPGDEGPADQSVYERAARDLWTRIGFALTGPQLSRLADSLEKFLNGHAAELDAELSEKSLDLESCLAIRAENLGCGFLQLFIEYGADVDMTDLLDTPPFVETHRHAMTHLILVNDLLSWRQVAHRSDRISSIRLLRDRDGLSLQDAVNLLCQLVERHERAYIGARSRILAAPIGNRPDVRAYLIGLDQLIAGGQEYEFLTPRNLGDGAVWDGTTSGWLRLDTPVAWFSDHPATDQSRGR